jgi:hypothetical protein
MVMTDLSERSEGAVRNGLKIRLDKAPSHNGAMARHLSLERATRHEIH